MRRVSKLTAADRDILARAMKDNGAQFIAQCIVSLNGWECFEEAFKGVRWGKKKLAAQRFTRDLLRDYTVAAILNAMEAIDPDSYPPPDEPAGIVYQRFSKRRQLRMGTLNHALRSVRATSK